MKANNITPVESPQRLYWRAPRIVKEPRLPAIKSIPAELPGWVAEHCASWLEPGRRAWTKILESDDEELMRAFGACEKEARITEYGQRYEELLKQKGQENWLSLHKQEMETILRKSKAREKTELL